MVRLTVFCLSVFAATAAQAQSYDCDMSVRGHDGFIPPRMLFSIEEEAQAGAVFDGIINAVHKAPIPVELKRRSDTQWRFFWNLKEVPSTNTGGVSLVYRATLDTKLMKVRVSGNIAGYDNDIRGEGTCKLIKS